MLRKLLLSLLVATPLLAQGNTADYAPIAPKAVHSTLIDVAMADSRLVAVGERGHVLYSDDDGQQWLQGKMPFQRMLTGVYFVDGLRGWAVGHQNMIFYTDDAGESWERQVDGFTFQRRYNEENLIRTRKAHEALSAELAASPDPDRELELEDALFAWEDAELALEEPPMPSNFHDVWFMDANTGWAIGAFGRLAETRDGGKSWTDKTHLVQTLDGFHLNAITGTAGGEVYIAGEAGVLFRSLDAGANWERLDAGYGGTFFGVTYDQRNSVLHVFGLGAALYQSRDKGETWQAISSPVPATFAGGATTADSKTVLVGPGGMVVLIDNTTGTIQPYPQTGRRNYSTALPLDDGSLILVGQGGPQRIHLE